MSQQGTRSTIRVRNVSEGVLYHLVFEGGLSQLTAQQLKAHLERISKIPAGEQRLTTATGEVFNNTDTGADVTLTDGSLFNLFITSEEDEGHPARGYTKAIYVTSGTTSRSSSNHDNYSGRNVGLVPTPARTSVLNGFTFSSRRNDEDTRMNYGDNRGSHGARVSCTPSSSQLKLPHDFRLCDAQQQQQQQSSLLDEGYRSPHYRSPYKNLSISARNNISERERFYDPDEYLTPRSSAHRRSSNWISLTGEQPSPSTRKQPECPSAMGTSGLNQSSLHHQPPSPAIQQQPRFYYQRSHPFSAHAHPRRSSPLHDSDHLDHCRPRPSSSHSHYDHSHKDDSVYVPSRPPLTSRTQDPLGCRSTDAGIHAEGPANLRFPVTSTALARVLSEGDEAQSTCSAASNALVGPPYPFTSAQLSELMAEREYVWYMEQLRFNTERDSRLQALQEAQQELSLAAQHLEREQALLSERRALEQERMNDLRRVMAMAPPSSSSRARSK